jgi:hypothetical protein
MPYGSWVNELPTGFFLLVHLTAFALGAFFAWRAIDGAKSVLGSGFLFYALGEVVYMTYHLDWTVFLFAHTIAEVLNLVAIVLIFVGAVASLRLRSSTGTTSRTSERETARA